MIDFPVTPPPDPDPEEVAYRRRLVASLQDTIDAFAGLDLSDEQRKALNDASRRAQSAAEGFAELDDKLSGRPVRKAPQRGRIPKRGARKRPEAPKATLEDVERLERELGL